MAQAKVGQEKIKKMTDFMDVTLQFLYWQMNISKSHKNVICSLLINYYVNINVLFVHTYVFVFSL